MSTSASLNLQAPAVQRLPESHRVPDLEIRALNQMAVQGLGSMLDAKSQLFCHRLVSTDQGLVSEGLSQRYSIMTLLGLREVVRTGASVPFDIEALYKSLLRDHSWIHSVGDLGLLIWLVAEFTPGQLEELFSSLHVDEALEHYADAREARTTELAWFLAGLAHAALACPKMVRDLTDLAVETYHLLEGNQGEYGLFGHMSTKKSMAGFLRGRIGSFADQVYPIYAMSKFATAFHVEEPLGAAVECATAICNAQGAMGQWWWLYESQTGRVSSRYPVYSVHQQGMAPMSLFALEAATGQSFAGPLYKGLRWIYGANELGADMRDATRNLIWRCILPKRKQTKYWDTAWSLVRTQKDGAPVGPLKILFEDRPYELGWLLYAFAKFGLPER